MSVLKPNFDDAESLQTVFEDAVHIHLVTMEGIVAHSCQYLANPEAWNMLWTGYDSDSFETGLLPGHTGFC